MHDQVKSFTNFIRTILPDYFENKRVPNPQKIKERGNPGRLF